MHLVDEQHRLLAVRGGPAGHVDDGADLLDPGRQRRQRLEPAAGGLRDQRRQRRLAGAGRAVEDDRRRAGALDKAAHRRIRRKQMVLADDLVEGCRPHPHRQRARRADGPAAPPVEVGSPGTSNRPSDTLSAYHGATTVSCVTKSISSSTRPISAGSRSFQSRTRPRMRCHALRDVRLLARAASPARRTRRASSPTPFGTAGHAAIPSRSGFDRLPDVDERMADHQRVRAARPARAPRRRSGPPWSRRPDGRRARRAVGPARDRTPRRWRPDRRPRRGIRRRRPRSADRHPTPVRRVRRRGGPRRRSGWPTRPSPVAPGTATEPDAVRVARCRRGPTRRGQDHRLAVDQIAGADGKRFARGRAGPRVPFARTRCGPPRRRSRSARPRRPCRSRPGIRSIGVSCADCRQARRSHSDQPPGDRRVTPALLPPRHGRGNRLTALEVRGVRPLNGARGQAEPAHMLRDGRQAGDPDVVV